VKGWFVVQTKPRNEDRAAVNLSHGGYEVINGKIRVKKRTNGFQKYVVEPLFPSYIFVFFDFERDYHIIKYTRGVRKVVQFGGRPIPVPSWTIEDIRRRLRNGVVEIEKPTPKRGDRVFVIDGPFKGLEAVFLEALNGGERVRILIEHLSYCARLVVGRDMLELGEGYIRKIS